MMLQQLSENSIFFISFGLVSISIIIGFMWCFSIYHNYNTSLKYEGEKEKIEVMASNSNQVKNDEGF